MFLGNGFEKSVGLLFVLGAIGAISIVGLIIYGIYRLFS